MLQFVKQKIKNKKWLNLCLLVGISLLAAVFTAHPMLVRGSGNQLLQTAFLEKAEEENVFPAIIGREENYETTNYNTAQAIYDRMDAYETKWREYIEIDTIASSQALLLSGNTVTSNLQSGNRFLMIGCIRDMEAHTEVVDGTSLADCEVEEGTYPCVISESVMDSNGLIVGEELLVQQSTDKGGTPVRLVIVGIIRQSAYDDYYWSTALNDYDKTLFVPEAAMDVFLGKGTYEKVSGTQQLLLNYTQIDCEQLSEYRSYLEQFVAADGGLLENFLETFLSVERQITSARLVLLMLELPCIVLLLLFLYMVSSQILTSEEGEIAVLRSRGVTRKQVVLLYMLQSVFLSVVGILLGMLFGYLMCKAAAGTDAFLKFVDKDVSLYRFTWQMIPYGVAACVVAILFLTLPVLRRAKMTIVEQKGMNKYADKKPFWEKCFLDVILLGISLYLLYNYNRQSGDLAFEIIDGENIDPLIFLDASLFLFSCGLVFLRFCRYLIAGVDRIGKKRWKPALYASFLQIRRTFHRQGFLSVFLIMTISGGIFDANMARTMNENKEQRILYDIGADVRMLDRWILDFRESRENDSVTGYVWSYDEPDYEKYTQMEKDGLCESLTRVIEDNNVDIALGRKMLNKCQLFGIHTKEFGETARLLDGLNDEHWFHALNALAQNAEGVIISRNVADELGVSVGETIRYVRYSPVPREMGKEMGSVTGTVCAIVDAFPGYDRYRYEQDETGATVLEENYLIVANYATVVGYYSLTPYTVWMRKAAGTDDAQITGYLEEKNADITKWSSAEELVARGRSEALVQITNGMFTMSFLISLLICSAGLLIYWIMSMKSRELLFGIYRAMGMRMRDIHKMLFVEQIFGSLLPVAAGGGAGLLGTLLFVKLIALVYLPEKHNIALRISTYGIDLLELFAVVLIVVCICLVVVRRLLAGMKIARALKLGED